MTKSELFKAAHKLAKAYKAQSNNSGDYIAYLSLALKNISAALINQTKERIFKRVNKTISNANLNCFITYTEKGHATHGQRTFSAMYELEKARKQLKDGQFFGKAFRVGKEIKAWVRSVTYSQVAY